MYDGVVSYIDGYMSAVADDVTGRCIGKAHGVSEASHGAGAVGQADTEVGIDAHDKAGAVGAIGQAGAAVFIRIANELAGISHNRIAGGRATAVSYDDIRGSA